MNILYLSSHISLALLLATSAGAQTCGPFTFDQLSVDTGTSPISIDLGDLNGDGLPDLAIANASTTSGISSHGYEGLRVAMNLGNGNFSSPQLVTSALFPNSIRVADINGDGNADLVASEYGQSGANHGVLVVMGHGDGSFEPAILLPFDAGHTEPMSVAVGDVDGDSDLDIVSSVGYAGFNQSAVAVLLNDGAGGFSAPAYMATGYGASSVDLGDFNADGNLDIVTADTLNQTATQLVGNGDGTFTRITPDITAGRSPKFVRLSDVDGDGADDVLLVNRTDVLVLETSGPSAAYDPGLRPVSLAAGDVDDDGDVDVIVANAIGDSVALLTNSGGGAFVVSTIATGDAPYSAAIADIDDDGDTDVLVSLLYENRAIELNNTCLSPACLPDVNGDGVLTPADFTAWIAAFNAGDPAADQNEDGSVDPSDFTAWIANFNAGCP